MRRVRRCFALSLILFLSVGCPDPFVLGGRLVSLPWGAEIPAPANVDVVYDASSLFLLSPGREWSAVLTVRRTTGKVPSGEAGMRRMLGAARELAARLPGRRWIRGRLSRTGGGRGLRFEFEGPPGRGQGAVYFASGERVLHRAGVWAFGGRIYSLHFQMRPSAKRFSSAVWTNLVEGIRFTRERELFFSSGDALPESDFRSVMERVLKREK